MRLLVIVATLLLIPAYAVILEWVFEWHQKPKLEEQLRKWLQAEQLQSVRVSLNHFDATLTGVCPDPAARDKAERIVQRLPVIRIRDGENKIEVPAKLTRLVSNGADKELRIGGWVDSPRTRSELLDIVKRFRPDLEPVAADLRLSPHVVMGMPVTVPAGTMPSAVADFLETIRAPSSLSITADKRTLRVVGHLPSNELRAQVVNVLKTTLEDWQVDASALNANEHVAAAAFAKAEALSAFLAEYYRTPMPGSFSITARNGPRMKAYATPSMVTRWLALLHDVSGSARVPLDDITYLPSVYHFPGYQPQSALAKGSMDASALRKLLAMQVVYFESGSANLVPTEAVKLGPIIYPITAAGVNARVIIAGFTDIGGEPNASKNVIGMLRATAVKKQLLRMGLSPDVLEVETFDAIKPTGVITDDLRRESRRVEFLLK
jgi:outer membrane protein OmpA-like peptidoglycan-associated protein